MKNFILYCALYAMIISCDNNNDEPDPEIEDCGLEAAASANYIMDTRPFNPKYPCDYMAAKKNGTDWKIFASTGYTLTGDTLQIMGYSLDESMSFKFLFTGIGTYELADVANSIYSSDNANYYTLVGGDVVTGYYSLSNTGLVEVTEYDEAEKVIKGYFQFSMKKHSGESQPETIGFKNGKFCVHLPD